MSQDTLTPERIPTPLSKPLESRREQVMERLQEAFGGGEVTLDEFDERMELARTATRDAELDILVADLLTGGALVPASAPASSSTALVPTRGQGKPLKLTAIFGSHERDGIWAPPDHIEAKAIFGSVELDFRHADIAPGSVTVVQCNAVFGSVEIEVAPHIRVEMEGSGILGSFTLKNKKKLRSPGEGEHPPILRVTGRAVFGSVEVKVKKPKKKLLKRLRNS